MTEQWLKSLEIGPQKMIHVLKILTGHLPDDVRVV